MINPHNMIAIILHNMTRNKMMENREESRNSVKCQLLTLSSNDELMNGDVQIEK
jgi:hypothetical protein